MFNFLHSSKVRYWKRQATNQAFQGKFYASGHILLSDRRAVEFIGPNIESWNTWSMTDMTYNMNALTLGADETVPLLYCLSI